MTAQLAPSLIYRDYDNNGNPLVNGQVFTYAAGTTIPQATYTDGTQLVPNTNPIILNFRGECPLWLNPSLAYKIVVTGPDPTGNANGGTPGFPVRSVDNVTGFAFGADLVPNLTNTYNLGNTRVSWANLYLGPQAAAAFDPTSGGIGWWAQTAAEIAAGVLPTDYFYQPGDPRRYGAKGDGVTDDTAALTAWGSVGGDLWVPGLTFLISAVINIASNSVVRGCLGAQILANNLLDQSLFQVSGGSNVTIRGIHFKQTGSYGTIGYSIGGICFLNSTGCLAENNILDGMQWGGVTLRASSNCTVRSNYFTNFTSGISDSADVAIISSTTASSAYNIVEGNFCFGGGFNGISIEDPYNNMPVVRNKVVNNQIGAHTAYGVLNYQPTSGQIDTYNEIIGNHIEGITGSADPSKGMGIYCVNAVGGTVIAHNIIRNCCINTANASLIPGGIGIGGISAGHVPVLISGNQVEGMTNYWSILVSGCPNGAAITGNTIRVPTTQTQIGGAIRVTNSNSVSVTGNSIYLATTTQNQDGITAIAQGASCSNISITGNTVNGGHFGQIRFAQTGGNVVAGISVVGNTLSGGDSSCIPLRLDSGAAQDAAISGNYINGSANNTASISQTACQAIRYANNRVSGGTVVLLTSGTCTNSFWDISNLGMVAGAGVSNGATGFIVDVFGTASAPSAGTYAVGDTVRNGAPAGTSVFLTICTTAGTGGGTAVFKTISNT